MAFVSELPDMRKVTFLGVSWLNIYLSVLEDSTINLWHKHQLFLGNIHGDVS